MRSDARGLEREGVSAAAREEGFGIEEIDCGGPAVHEEKDDALGFAGEGRSLCLPGGFAGEHGMQGEGSESGSGSLQHFPAGKREAHSMTTQAHGYSTYKNSLLENNTLA